jgi:hypothetical protein
VTGSCESDYEPVGSGATELVCRLCSESRQCETSV